MEIWSWQEPTSANAPLWYSARNSFVTGSNVTASPAISENCRSNEYVAAKPKPPGPRAAVMIALPRVGAGVATPGVPSQACDPLPSPRSTGAMSVVTGAS